MVVILIIIAVILALGVFLLISSVTIVATVAAVFGSIFSFAVPADAAITAMNYVSNYSILAAGNIKYNNWNNYDSVDFSSFCSSFDESEFLNETGVDKKYFDEIKGFYERCLGCIIEKKLVDSISYVPLCPEDVKTGSDVVKLNGTYYRIVKSQTEEVSQNVVLTFSPDTNNNYSNDFGNLRIHDGKNESHEGTDLFADRNTPLVSMEDCYINKIGWNGLGGWTIYAEGKNGNRRYYYAHMENYSERFEKYKKVPYSVTSLFGREEISA